jgi:hypothetical protein
MSDVFVYIYAVHGTLHGASLNEVLKGAEAILKILKNVSYAISI